MIRNILLLVIMVCSSAGIFAGRPTVYLNKFENSGKIKNGLAEMVRGAVLEGMYNTNLVNIIDADTEATRYEEELRRLKENLATDDLETTEALQTRGENVLISGDITAFPIEKGKYYRSRKDSVGETRYKASATFILRLVNAVDGTMLKARTFNISSSYGDGFHYSDSKTEAKAIQSVKSRISNAMRDFTIASFPKVAMVEGVGEISKNNKDVKTLYIGLGSDDGIMKGYKYNVCVQKQVGSKVVTDVIGKVEVTSVSGRDISLCKVKKGGSEIKRALDLNQPLYVVTTL